MEIPKVSLLFVIDTFGKSEGKIAVYIQRGDVNKRIGPFVGSSAHKFLYDYLPIQDQKLLKQLEDSGLLDFRSIDSRIHMLPDLLEKIWSHQNLFIRTKKFGSIRKITQKEITNLSAPNMNTQLIQPGKILGGCLDISDTRHIHLSWRYAGIKNFVPFSSITAENNFIQVASGQAFSRDINGERKMLDDLSRALSLPIQNIFNANFIQTDLQKLSTLSETKWLIIRNGTVTRIKIAKPHDFGIAWFEGTHTEPAGIFEFKTIADAYLNERAYIEQGNNLIILPELSSKEISEKTALKITDREISDSVATSIVSVRKNFTTKETSNLSSELKNIKFKGVLRKYQLEGVLWLNEICKAHLGGILADEMGLGKTVQTLAFIKYKKFKKILIVSPASVVPNWNSEIKNFCPDICTKTDLTLDNQKSKKTFVYLTSYQYFLLKKEEFQNICFDAVILDEGQFVKNHTTKTASALKNLNPSFRLVLTGTPIENSVKDLWSHLIFTNPPLRSTYKKLLSQIPDFGKNTAAATLSAKAFGPLILRRTKQSVSIDLPPMVEKIVYCPMSAAQKHIYQQVLSVFRCLIGSGMSARVNSIALEAILRLRQCCSTPQLLPTSLNSDLIFESSKIEVAASIITEDFINNRKTIVFSQFRKTLDLLSRKLSDLGISSVRLDGSTSDRRLPVEAFQKDENIRVFLVGFKAGGTGLNLTAGESVILFDPWWNPAAEDQAYARAHRIGQNKTVVVSKLICPDTIEEKMLSLISKKEALMDHLEGHTATISTSEIIKLITTN